MNIRILKMLQSKLLYKIIKNNKELRPRVEILLKLKKQSMNNNEKKNFNIDIKYYIILYKNK